MTQGDKWQKSSSPNLNYPRKFGDALYVKDLKFLKSAQFLKSSKAFLLIKKSNSLQVLYLSK